MNEEEEEKIYAIRPNKSQLKRDMQKRIDTITQLVDLSPNDIKKLVTDTFVLSKINEAKPLKSSGAKNRLFKYLAKHMDGELLAKVDKFINDRHGYERISNAFFHGLEKKRDMLLEKGDSGIQLLMDEFPTINRQELRQLVRQGVKEKETGKPVGASRKLFRYLRENLEEKK